MEGCSKFEKMDGFQRNDTLKFWMDMFQYFLEFWDDQLLNLKRICQEGLAGVKYEPFFPTLIGVDERWFFKLPTKNNVFEKVHVLSFFVKLPIATMVVSRKSPAFAITPTESRSPRLPPRLIPGASTGGAKMEAAAVLSMAWRPVVRNAGDFIIPMRLVSSSNEATDLFLAQMDPKLIWTCLFLYKQVLGSKMDVQ